MKIARVLTAAFAFLAYSGAAHAHHSFTMFDRGKKVVLTGTVRALNWANPHVYLWIDTLGAGGDQKTWAIEFSDGPSGLSRKGWSKDSLKPGEKIIAEISPLKDGRAGGTMRRILAPDGTVRLDLHIDPAPGDVELLSK